MQDVIPPRRPERSSTTPPDVQPEIDSTQLTQTPELTPDSSFTVDEAQSKRPTKRKKRLLWILVIIVLIIGIVCVGAVTWYRLQLQPVSSTETADTRISIESGTGPDGISTLLKKHGLIRSKLAFDWYVRLHHSSNKLQAGVYTLKSSMSLPDIISHIQSGKTDSLTITFLPGATIAQDKNVLKKAGFSSSHIDAAFNAKYDHPLFASKPASAGLEGYIYGETYQFSADVTVEAVLKRTFDEFYGVIESNDLIARYKKHGLTLYQGITLASIVQREVMTPQDAKQVAQVFYLRLKKDIPLGSDVTYQYAADTFGEVRDPTSPSPYNTRRHKGLPPGPIATPGLSALQAVASPARGDFLYFLSGDDDKTYFSHTETEHQKNITAHCQKKCSVL